MKPIFDGYPEDPSQDFDQEEAFEQDRLEIMRRTLYNLWWLRVQALRLAETDPHFDTNIIEEITTYLAVQLGLKKEWEKYCSPQPPTPQPSTPLRAELF